MIPMHHSPHSDHRHNVAKPKNSTDKEKQNLEANSSSTRSSAPPHSGSSPISEDDEDIGMHIRSKHQANVLRGKQPPSKQSKK